MTKSVPASVSPLQPWKRYDGKHQTKEIRDRRVVPIDWVDAGHGVAVILDSWSSRPGRGHQRSSQSNVIRAAAVEARTSP